jgi:anaerobic magnesium-protoporphyrin IX monomethyl ester cyclase
LKIALINLRDGISKNEYPQLGLLYLASIARQKGHIVDFLDCSAKHQSIEGTLRELKKFKPDICGFSLYTQGLRLQYKFIKDVKKHFPGSIIFVGGPHASALPERTMEECKEINYLIFGEGEVTFAELTEAIQENEKTEHIDGVCYRLGKKVIKNKHRKLIADLDSIPFPAYDLIYRKGYQYHNRKMEVGGKPAAIISSRGCPWNCVFCYKGTFGRTYRRRSPENVVEEMIVLIERYGVNDITFVDDLFAVNKRWLREFCARLKEKKVCIPWKCLGRVDTLSIEDMKMMRGHGCYGIEFGVESGNQEVLKDINKKITIPQVKRAFKAAKDTGLMTSAFFIFGNRLDTRKSIIQTMELAREIKPDFAGFAVLLPFPGTRIYQMLDEGIKYKWELYGSYYGYLHTISVCSVDAMELQEFGKQASPEYYGRIHYLIDNIVLSKHHIKIRKYQLLFFGYFFIKNLLIRIKSKRIFS